MKTTQYPHGVAFEHRFTAVLKGQIEGCPVGWGTDSHEVHWLEDSLRGPVKDAVERYYQCQLRGTSFQVVLEQSTIASCTFCDQRADPQRFNPVKQRSDLVAAGWRTMKSRWICPRCMKVIRQSADRQEDCPSH